MKMPGRDGVSQRLQKLSCKIIYLAWGFLVFLCSEALPFFLLLIDLSKASALTKFALSSDSQVRLTCVIL